jgi:hypothetical protein
MEQRWSPMMMVTQTGGEVALRLLRYAPGKNKGKMSITEPRGSENDERYWWSCSRVA